MIKTLEELEALPEDTPIRDVKGFVWESAGLAAEHAAEYGADTVLPAVLKSEWLAEERAQARREAITEFAKQHGIGDLESRPLYDAEQYIADLESEVEWLRRENRRLEEQAVTTQPETLREAAGDFAFTDDMWRDYQGLPSQGYSHRDFLEHVVGKWLRDRAAKLGAK